MIQAYLEPGSTVSATAVAASFSFSVVAQSHVGSFCVSGRIQILTDLSREAVAKNVSSKAQQASHMMRAWDFKVAAGV